MLDCFNYLVVVMGRLFSLSRHKDHEVVDCCACLQSSRHMHAIYGFDVHVISGTAFCFAPDCVEFIMARSEFFVVCPANVFSKRDVVESSIL